jgi:flagellar biogenesis protein FliO
MGTLLGLLGLVVFIVCVIALAASVTWLVVKLTPQRDRHARESP